MVYLSDFERITSCVHLCSVYKLPHMTTHLTSGISLSTVEMVKPGNTVIFRNARIDMFKDTMRLAVDKWGLIEVVEEPADFKVNEDNNMSEIEYELVNVPPKKQERKK
ncbi:hypothetical protein ACQJBY_072554 [Aegilops geniculata]